jgi:hypothetical protein
MRATIHLIANLLGDPSALPVRHQKSDNFGNVLHLLFLEFCKAVHVHEHVNVYVNARRKP